MLICSISKYIEISDNFLLKIKLCTFLNGHITYQSHMSISMFKPSTYAFLWPIEFCQIVVTFGRICSCWRTDTTNQRGGSEWEPIKFLLEGDRGSKRMNMACNTRLWLNYPSWSRPCSHWSATDPRNNKQPSEPKLTNTHSGNLHGLLPVLHWSDRWHRSDRWTELVSRWLRQPHNKCSKEPQWLLLTLEQKHPKNTTCMEEGPYTKPTKTPPKLPRTDQHRHNPKTHGFSNSPEENPTKVSHR
jgi:hypothetical protein